MVINYIFSGIGQAAGEYKISNEDIYRACKQGLLSGFDEAKVLSSKNYQAFLEQHQGVSPFDYFAKYKMGFINRHSVMPFPPKKKHFLRTENATEMAVRAIQEAFDDSSVLPSEIDAWFVSTVSPHEKAPGIAATIKSYFVDKENLTPAYTLTSGCSGFNIHLERAIEFLKTHPKAKHVVVAHTEVMSQFLTEKSKFVSFVTFGDAAGAVILSRVEGESKEGIVSIENHQDLKMIDFVGVDKLENLYMDESVIKKRAVKNIVKTTQSILKTSDWNLNDIDWLVPHQTGNAILMEVAGNLNFPTEKLFLEAQKEYGNVSGATVLLSLSMLRKSAVLSSGQKLLSATAGVGGEYGAFTYIVPKTASKTHKKYQPLKGKKALVIGATGGLGQYIVKALADSGAEVLLQYRNPEKLSCFSDNQVGLSYKADLSNATETQHMIEQIKAEHNVVNYLIFANGVSGSVSKAQEVSVEELSHVYRLNYEAAVQIYQGLFPLLKDTVLWLGSAAEDAHFQGSSSYTSTKRSLHGFAASASWEAFSRGLKMVYYMPGVVDVGMTEQLNEKQKFIAMQQINQTTLLNPKNLAKRIVQSLYAVKVYRTDDSFENILTVRRDGYIVSDGRW